MTAEHPESVWYPENDVLAVFDEPEQVDAVIASLSEAGVHAGDILVLRGQDVVERIDASGEHCGLLRHLAWFLASGFSEEREFAREYEAEGRAGHSIVAVHVHRGGDVDRVREIAAAHGGHDMKFFGHWAISELAPSTREA